MVSPEFNSVPEFSPCEAVPHHVTLRPAGFEPATPGLGNRCPESVTRDAATSYDPSDPALTDPLTELFRKDPDFGAVISAWPGLPEAVRARIVGLVEGATAAAG
jgi:hypothetical protein